MTARLVEAEEFDELIERCERAVESLMEQSEDSRSAREVSRLQAKASGVELAISYIREFKTMGWT